MSENTAPEGVQVPQDGADEEVVPDYSRVGFRALQALCKDRGIPGDGNSIALVEKLKAWDVQHGKDVDLSAAEGIDPHVMVADDDFDLLADDPEDLRHVFNPMPHAPHLCEDCGQPPHYAPGGQLQHLTSESPVGGGEAASASSPTGAPTAGEDVIGVGTTQPAGTITNLPAGSTMTSAFPAAVVRAAPATRRGGRADLAVRGGIVKVGEAHGAAEVRAFRREFSHGSREITDRDHFGYIAETHVAAAAAGHVTKGGITVGERVDYGVDGEGQRTVIYQVPLKRQR